MTSNCRRFKSKRRIDLSRNPGDQNVQERNMERDEYLEKRRQETKDDLVNLTQYLKWLNDMRNKFKEQYSKSDILYGKTKFIH